MRGAPQIDGKADMGRAGMLERMVVTTAADRVDMAGVGPLSDVAPGRLGMPAMLCAV